MGQGFSIESALTKQNALIQEIHSVIKELGDNYSSQFLDPNFCNRVALIYNDKLVKYRRQDVDGISYTLGLVNDVPSTKGKVCEAIIKHYTDRLNLMAGIQYSISYVSDRIFALTIGPRCDGNPEIFDQEKCKSSGGRWQPYVVMPDVAVPENQTWFKYLKSLQDDYLYNLQKLLGILNQLKNYDSDITDERLRRLGDESKTIIDAMHKHAYEMYKLLLTTPTYTKEERQHIDENAQTEQQDNAARLAALRIANGLPPKS